ncbi:MAG: hypothetical protein IIB56_09740 [Planctomycetes bacterium]|nr:hypothetical protein [Planctomycetota bacterium]
MSKEILIDHDEIRDSQTITGVIERKFKERGLNIHMNDVERLYDDHDKKVRVLTIKNTKYFFT